MTKLDDEVGFDRKPDKYSGEGGQLETIDRMRLMLRNWAGASGLHVDDLLNWDEEQLLNVLNTDLIGDLMFLGFCMATEFKYDDRAGKKMGNTEERDIRKGEWYRRMAEHVQGEGQDPRLEREGWSPEVEFGQWPLKAQEAIPDESHLEGEVRGWTDDGTAWIMRCPYCGDLWTYPANLDNALQAHPCDQMGEIWLEGMRPELNKCTINISTNHGNITRLHMTKAFGDLTADDILNAARLCLGSQLDPPVKVLGWAIWVDLSSATGMEGGNPEGG